MVIAFLPRSKHLLISRLQSPSAVILEPKKISLSLFPLFPYLPWSDGTECHYLSFLNVEFQSSFFILLLYFHQEALSAIRVVSSVYLRLLIFLLAILIPACASSSSAFCMMYSAYKVKQVGWQYTALMYSFSYLEPVCCSMPSSNCCFLNCI